MCSRWAWKRGLQMAVGVAGYSVISGITIAHQLGLIPKKDGDFIDLKTKLYTSTLLPKSDMPPESDPSIATPMSLPDLFEKTRRSVVCIQSQAKDRQRTQKWWSFRNANEASLLAGLGTGFCIDEGKGMFLTNAHVVMEYWLNPEDRNLRVQTWDGQKFPAEVHGFDLLSDTAIVRVKQVPESGNLPWKAVEFAKNCTLRPGESVFTIGSPLGLTQTLATGIVASTGRKAVEMGLKGATDARLEFVQTCIPSVAPGFSGGPLFNMHGQVIGMNGLALDGEHTSPGICMSACVDFLQHLLIPELTKHGDVVRPWLGVDVRPLRHLVEDYACFQKNDQFTRMMKTLEQSALAGLQYERLGWFYYPFAFFGPWFHLGPADILGPRLMQDFYEFLRELEHSMTKQMLHYRASGKGGVLVKEVKPESPASKVGLQTFDLIVAVDGQAVDGPTELARALYIPAKGAGIQLTVERYVPGKEQRKTMKVDVHPETLTMPRKAAQAAIQDSIPLVESLEDFDKILDAVDPENKRAFL